MHEVKLIQGSGEPDRPRREFPHGYVHVHVHVERNNATMFPSASANGTRTLPVNEAVSHPQTSWVKAT